MIRRRQFIAILGGAAATWPLAARAQQVTTPVVGFLDATAPDQGTGAFLKGGLVEGRNVATAAFLKGLSEAGFVEGRNVAMEIRSANNDYRRLPELAVDLVRRRVDVIYANGGSVAALAAKAATTNIPIVFAMGDDPVASGLVTDLGRPGGNVTGIAFLSMELGPKRLGLLNALVPAATQYALLVNPDAPNTNGIVAGLRAAADSLGRHIEVFTASDIRQIDAAFADLVRKGAEALIVGGSSLLNSRRVQLATLAAHYHLPAIYYDRRNVEVGGLMSYGADILDAVRLGGVYVSRILKGEKPADLPILQATKFEFAINLETARTLGLTVPPSLLALADEVIE